MASNPTARARDASNGLRASLEEGTPISAVLGLPSTPVAQPLPPPPIPGASEEDSGSLPPVFTPAERRRVVGKCTVRLDGRAIQLPVGKVISAASYGADIFDRLHAQGVAFEACED